VFARRAIAPALVYASDYSAAEAPDVSRHAARYASPRRAMPPPLMICQPRQQRHALLPMPIFRYRLRSFATQ